MVQLLPIAAAAAGLLSHVCYFNRGEHHFYGVRYLQAFIAVFAFAVLALYQQGTALDEALAQVIPIASCYLAGLYASLIAYRTVFHPLNKFPGPFGAKISKLWLSAQLKNADAHRKVHMLHQQYGDFVRVGSSDLSITHPKAVSIIYGQGSKCTKADFYDLTKPMVSLQTLRVKALHDQRRRIWSPAFSDKALRGYEERTKKYCNQLLSRIEAFHGQPVNVSKWLNLYTFDVMGDLAFGASFNMLETSEEHWAIKLLNAGMEPVSWLFPMWFFRMMSAIPGLMRDFYRFIDYCAERLEERMNTKVDTPDIMSTLLSALQGSKPTPEEMHMLRGDSQLIVVAGSDTNAATLTHIMLELARHPEHISKLRDELAPYMPDPSANISHQAIANLDHLNGIIYEALRLHPPVPTAVQRLTPPEGIEIGGTHIPGNMTVWCPQYVIGRKEDIYTRAYEFIPERWYLYPEMIKEKSAWAPFSIGPYGCIGRSLALMNIRTTLARLIMGFDIKFAPADEADQGKRFEIETKDHFTLGLAKLEICFVKRG